METEMRIRAQSLGLTGLRVVVGVVCLVSGLQGLLLKSFGDVKEMLGGIGGCPVARAEVRARWAA